ncbi:MAG: hypothetical protein HQK52_21015 [Oligoflexia bacterium]|nr:hypothetical protein [Oligoflexia bacterium]
MIKKERPCSLRHDLKKDLRCFRIILDEVFSNEEKIDPKMTADATLILSQLKLNWDEYINALNNKNKNE